MSVQSDEKKVLLPYANDSFRTLLHKQIYSVMQTSAS